MVESDRSDQGETDMTKSCLTIASILAGLAFSAPAAAQSPRVVTQPPCPYEYCLEFGWDSPTDLTVRTIEKVSPITGSAIVTFHGMLGCAPTIRELSRLVSLQSQIVGLADATPDGSSNGGHTMTALLWNNLSGGPNYAADTFNLASTRIFTVTEGQNLRVALRLSRLNMSTDVNCVVRKSAAFTIQFVE